MSGETVGDSHESMGAAHAWEVEQLKQQGEAREGVTKMSWGFRKPLADQVDRAKLPFPAVYQPPTTYFLRFELS
ncbi:hypothetical protein KM043_014651 [Ampulex compressa]|nr:hypothetical protein KM043_014651 [Ampulex compressa]